METPRRNKKKVFNDPVYGFVSIPFDIIFDLIEHPYFQRLRRIKQLGLTHFVYPGALHTRFHHALGALHLMGLSIEVLRSKGQEITEAEAEAVSIGILLHDIGHGPYSHTLENCLIKGLDHEFLSDLFMNKLNDFFGGRLSLAISIFQDKYHKRFLHQLISSQLDMDRLDYLKRDSFFTGVYEGVIGHDRIIKMLEVKNDQLVIEHKGIYSIEKFLVARRLMYWQVYLHKTVIGAEQMLVKILQRAKEIAASGGDLFATPPLHYFLFNNITGDNLEDNEEALEMFLLLDDYDVLASVKAWISYSDVTLSNLCNRLINRRLFKIELKNEPFADSRLEELTHGAMKLLNLNSRNEASYFVFTSSTSNSAYDPEESSINILYKDQTVLDVAKASDQLNISVLSKPVTKYYLCYPKELANQG